MPWEVSAIATADAVRVGVGEGGERAEDEEGQGEPGRGVFLASPWVRVWVLGLSYLLHPHRFRVFC
jgi:hypothetical protein